MHSTGETMKTKHLSKDGAAVCGAVVPAHRIVTDKGIVNCKACRAKAGLKPLPVRTNDAEPDWNRKCMVCGQSPVVPISGLCGPCTFGEADTAGGNW
jgi:CO dehydrogenase/acetyl-CoA synthase alpha subunit